MGDIFFSIFKGRITSRVKNVAESRKPGVPHLSVTHCMPGLEHIDKNDRGPCNVGRHIHLSRKGLTMVFVGRLEEDQSGQGFRGKPYSVPIQQSIHCSVLVSD